MAETTYIKAITSTLATAMRADERVLVLGEDVAEGGPYTATAGLAEEFGTDRVINTPISEAAITGVAIGAAQSGLRPVLEIMFIDFITLALDQLVNAAAKAHFMSGGQLTVPMVLRTQGGAGQRGAAQHSQSLESWLTHVPGLKVVMPSRAVDAAELLAAAIADPNPVVFIENKTLYFRKDEVPEGAAPVPIGEAVTLREGSDVTIVALSRLVHDALAAADRLAAGRHRGGGDRPADARSARPRGDRGVRHAYGQARRRPRGRRARGFRRRDRSAGAAGCASTSWTRPSLASARRLRRSRSARRWRTPTCPARTRSWRPSEQHCRINHRGRNIWLPDIEEVRVYDYVIVGAGSAGCVLAGRLSEDPDVRVAVLEAGGWDNRPEIAMPMAFPMLFKSTVDWDLYGEPEPGLDGRRLSMPRGKVVGGSGSINAMIYIRGNRADYDGWAAGGAEGWSYDEVLPYFKRSEDNERGEDEFHGVGGPMSVSDSRAMSPLIETMLEASRLAGHELNPDFNGAVQEGVGAFSSRSATGGAARPPLRSCTRHSSGRTWTSSPTRWRSASSSTARARWASRSHGAARSRRSVRSGR